MPCKLAHYTQGKIQKKTWSPLLAGNCGSIPQDLFDMFFLCLLANLLRKHGNDITGYEALLCCVRCMPVGARIFFQNNTRLQKPAAIGERDAQC